MGASRTTCWTPAHSAHIYPKEDTMLTFIATALLSTALTNLLHRIVTLDEVDQLP